MDGLWIFVLFLVVGGSLARLLYLRGEKFLGKKLAMTLSFAIVLGFLVLGVTAYRSFVEST